MIKDFLLDNFSLDPDEICFQRAHRIDLLRRARTQQGLRPRALTGAFRDYEDFELILSNALILFIYLFFVYTIF